MTLYYSCHIMSKTLAAGTVTISVYHCLEKVSHGTNPGQWHAESHSGGACTHAMLYI